MQTTRIKRLRERLAESQETFGARFPVDRRTIIRWELGEVSPSPMARRHMQDLERSLDPAERSEQASDEPTVPRRRGVMPSSD